MMHGSISLNPFKVSRILGMAAVLLVLASIAGQVTLYMTGHKLFGLVTLFYVDAEHNIPTAFSGMILFFAFLLLALITVLEKKRAASHVLHWAVLSIGFLVMAVDETRSFHEMLIAPVRRGVGGGHLGLFYFAWVIPAMGLLLVLMLYFMGFWWRLPLKTRWTFLMAGGVYIGGCIGVELLGGRYAEVHGMQNLTFSMLSTLEESLEMAGVILFIRGLLAYLADNHQTAQFRLDDFCWDVMFSPDAVGEQRDNPVICHQRPA